MDYPILKKILSASTVLCLFLVSCSLKAHNPSSPFIANKGQWTGPFQYKAQFGNLTVFCEKAGFTYVLAESIPHPEHNRGASDHHPLPEMIRKHAFRLTFNGAESIEYFGVDVKKEYHNYILGNDRSKWKGHVPLYSGVRAESLYEGVDISVYSEHNSFKYDFIVHPQADASIINFNYSGTDDILFSNDGIVIKTSVGDIIESIPVSYQLIEGNKIEVDCRYIKKEGGFGFEFPNGYNKNFPLIIDPILVASTLSGTTTNFNFGHGATFDLAGNIYTHAISFDSDYPTDLGSFQENYGGGGTDAAISKLNPNGSELIYATFIGGSGGEYPHSTITNANQELFVFGITSSNDLPVAEDAFQSEYGGGGDDIFVFGLSADGSELVGGTYLGGSSADGRNMVGSGYENFRGEINVNLNGEIYIASCSSSDNFPVTEGVFQGEKKSNQDGVIVKLSSDLSEIIWSSFVGSSADDMSYGVRIKNDQTVFISGVVGGMNNPGTGEGFVTTSNAYQQNYSGGENDSFVMQISADGTEILNSTFLGLEESDKAFFLDIDSNDDVWVYMQSLSSWPITEGVWGEGTGNILVHKLNLDLSELLITSYLTEAEGAASGTPVAFMVDLCNGIYISAYGVFGDFVASEDALFAQGGFYIGVFAPDMSDLVYGTFYTGDHVDGGTSRFDTQGIVYQGVCSGGGFNTTSDAWSTTQPGGWDIGVFKIDFEIESVNAVAGAAGYLTGCAPHNVIFQNFSSGENFEWNFGDGNSSTDYTPTHVYDEPGDYLVSLIVIDSNSCNLRDTAYIPITVYPEVEFFIEFTHHLDCETGEIVIINESEGPEDVEYEWNMGDGTILYEEDPSYIYNQAGEYIVTLNLTSEACNQGLEEEQLVIYEPFVSAEFAFEVVDICDAFTVAFYDLSGSANEFIWNLGDGNEVFENGNFEYNYQSSGTYEVQLYVSNLLSCNLADSITQIIEIAEPPVLDPLISITQIQDCHDLLSFAEVNPNGPASTYSWTIDGMEIGTDQSLEHHVFSPGIYTFVVAVTEPVCEVTYTDSVEFEYFDDLGYDIPSPAYLCYYEEEYTYNATVPIEGATYLWNSGLSTEPVLGVSQPGAYQVEISYNGCVDLEYSVLNVVPELPLSFESIICEGVPNTIEFPLIYSEIIEDLTWNNGQSGFYIELSESGYHRFTAVDIVSGCYFTDSLLTIARDDDPNLDIPNVFTPNGDGHNDLYQINGDSLVYFQLEIYNRWGQTVFSTETIYAGWDGNYTNGSGKEAGENTFMYILKYRDYCDIEDQILTGNISILR